MKKLMNWMIAAILLCGTSVMTSCFIDDNPVDIPEINAKCASYSVSFKFEAPVANNAFFQTRYAWWNGETKHGPLTAYGNFISQTYPSKDDLTFPAQEAFFLHYKVKDVAIEGNYTLNSKGEYTITTYDKDGTVLDTKTHAWNLEQGGVATAVDLDIAQATAYVELLVSIDKDGIITFTDNSMKEDESQSGIVW